METVHRIMAYLVVAAVGVGLATTAAGFSSRRIASLATDRLHAGVVALIVLAAASGVAMLVTGSSPPDGMHFFYAGVAILMLPLARSFAADAPGRRRTILLLAAFVALGAVVYRLFATG